MSECTGAVSRSDSCNFGSMRKVVKPIMRMTTAAGTPAMARRRDRVRRREEAIVEVTPNASTSTRAAAVWIPSARDVRIPTSMTATNAEAPAITRPTR